MTESGLYKIEVERIRQITHEGYDAEHDKDHTRDLIRAAKAYSSAADAVYTGGLGVFKRYPPLDWPWSDDDWKPSEDAERNLVKAGALIAAAIDSMENR